METAIHEMQERVHHRRHDTVLNPAPYLCVPQGKTAATFGTSRKHESVTKLDGLSIVSGGEYVVS